MMIDPTLAEQAAIRSTTKPVLFSYFTADWVKSGSVAGQPLDGVRGTTISVEKSPSTSAMIG